MTSVCVPVEQGMNVSGFNSAGSCAVISLCISETVFDQTQTHTHKGTGKCETSSVDGHSLYSMIWSLVDQ